MDGLLVVDASIAVKWLIHEDDSHMADRLLEGDHRLFAPQLMSLEVGNALRNKTRRGELENWEAEDLASSISEFAVDWITDEELVVEALRLSLTLNHPIYDCSYLALANQIGATVVTADKQFLQAVAKTEHQDSVAALEDFAAA